MAEMHFSLEIHVKNLKTDNTILKRDLNLETMQKVFQSVEDAASDLAIACHDNKDLLYRITVD